MSSNTTQSDDSSESFQKTGITIDSLHVAVVDTLSNAEWARFDEETRELEIQTDSSQSEFELKFTGYFDDPRTNDPPEQIGHPEAVDPDFEINHRKVASPKSYTFDDYEEAHYWTEDYAITNQGIGRCTVVVFIPSTSCIATVEPTE